MGYPLVLSDLSGARCVVVGGGSVAERKVAGLLEGGARPEVISPALTPALSSWREQGAILHQPRRYHRGDLEGALLVFATTDDPEVNARVVSDGARAGALVNSADDPEAGAFHTVASVRRGDLLLTVSTEGASPALAAFVRRDLEARYGSEYAALLDLLRLVRHEASRRLNERQRERLWRGISIGRLLEQIRGGGSASAESDLRSRLALVAEE
jgi:precorrin-2 dehydrogenase / sirohydrochlorin ferrochelatase